MITRDYRFVRTQLIERREIAFLDVREEAPHAEGHPLFAANLACGRIELEAFARLPRLDVPIVTLDAGEGLAERAARRLWELGYSDVAVFDGGLDGWKAAGGELFIDVNVPSKSFGELLEATCHTPSLSAETVRAMLDAGEDMVVLDVRRPDEYRTMSIPTGINVPGAELVLRVPDLAADPGTRVVVNCAGRTRSLVGAQSLINAGIPNEVVALRNGTIGWTLAGQRLNHGGNRTFSATGEESRRLASQRARAVADRAGVGRVRRAELDSWLRQDGRTTYCFDVRSIGEFEAGHLPGSRPYPGGQLVQETDMAAPVRGARIALVDDDGARANMTASWLAQMAWEVYVVDDLDGDDFSASGPWRPRLPTPPETAAVEPVVLARWLDRREAVVIDVTRIADYRRGHVPGAWYLLRSDIESAVRRLPRAGCWVVTSEDGELARFAAPELEPLADCPVRVLTGGTAAWREAGYALQEGESRLASPPIDRYRRPYEGTDAPPEAMQAYLDWEYGLVEQLRRDGSHHFRPLCIVRSPT